MPWPYGLEVATVTGRWFSPVSGTPLVGSAKLTPFNSAQSPVGQLILAQTSGPQTLASGAASWSQVVLSDSAGLDQELLYRLDVTGIDYSRQRLIRLSKAQVVAGVLDLSQVPDVVAAPQAIGPSYLLSSSLGTPGGPAGPLDGAGLVPSSQLPVSGGSAPATRLLTAGSGLLGGGNLTADRTFSLDPSAVDLAGTASSSMAGHLAAGDPHPQYLTPAEGNATYLPINRVEDPLEKYGLVAASGRFGEFMDPGTFTNQFVVVRTWIAAGAAFSRMTIPIRTTGVFTPGSGRPNQLAWWDDNGVLQQVTPNDDHMWDVADWYVASLPANNPAQVAGRWVYSGFSVNGTTGSSVYVLTRAFDGGGVPFSHAPGSSKRFGAYAAGVTALGNFNPNTIGTLTSFVPFIGFLP